MKITKTLVDKVVPPESGQVFYRDSHVKGFALRVTAKGTKSFILERKVKGKSQRITIGRYPDITAEQAKKKTQEIISRIVLNGYDPAKAKREAKISSFTLDQVFQDYVKHKSLKPNTLRGYDAAMRLAFNDWRDLPMARITKEKVLERFKELSDHSLSRANHHMRLLSALFNYAIPRHESSDGKPLITVNPVRFIGIFGAWNKESRRKSYIKPNQLPAWWKTVNELGGIAPNLNDVVARDYLMLLLFTGLRRREGATLTWENVDFDQRTLFIPDTKNHEPHTLPMVDFIYDLLKRREGNGSRYVYPSKAASGHLESVNYQIKQIRETSGVNFMIHDLRRTFITAAESLNISSYVLKRLLNHKSDDITESYIISDVERLREPMQQISVHLLKMAQHD